MPLLVVNGAITKCTFGMAPGNLVVLPVHRVFAGGMPAANITDFVPMINIMPFAMCQSIANPTVAAATSAAQGVLTPMPCIPMTTSPWTPGCAKTLLDGSPALNDTSICNCMWAGVISITMAGQVTVMVD